jgi:hypothetical protein
MGSQLPSEPQRSDATPNSLPGTAKSDALPIPTPDIPDAVFWRSVQRWGSLAIVLLVSGVLLRNWRAMTTPVPLVAASPPSSQVARSPLEQSANSAGNAGGRSTAAIAARSTPQTANPVVETTVLSLLQAARAKTWNAPNQAYPYQAAIQVASQIQPGQPQYQAAQQEIAGWSRTIFSIAQQHAQRQDLVSAVRAAAWVPADQPGYGEAQRAIAQWCPHVRQLSPTTIDRQQAQAICRSGK